MAPTHKTNSTKFVKKDKLYIPVKIINTPVDATTEPYIVQELPLVIYLKLNTKYYLILIHQLTHQQSAHLFHSPTSRRHRIIANALSTYQKNDQTKTRLFATNQQ